MISINEMDYRMHGARMFEYVRVMNRIEFSHTVANILRGSDAKLFHLELEIMGQLCSIARMQKLDYQTYLGSEYVRNADAPQLHQTNHHITPTIQG
jgi:hypothetical protein